LNLSTELRHLVLRRAVRANDRARPGGRVTVGLANEVGCQWAGRRADRTTETELGQNRTVCQVDPSGAVGCRNGDESVPRPVPS
jgi:hypothetical protein